MQSNASLRKRATALQGKYYFFATFRKEALTFHGKILILATLKDC